MVKVPMIHFELATPAQLRAWAGAEAREITNHRAQAQEAGRQGQLFAESAALTEAQRRQRRITFLLALASLVEEAADA
jgi:hypothetical protein